MLAQWPHRTPCVSAEESAQQVRRAERLDAVRPELWLLPETSLPHIIAAIDDVQPSLVVIDSIQSIADPDVPSAPVAWCRFAGARTGWWARPSAATCPS